MATLKDTDELIELIDDDIASLDKNMPREGHDVCLCTLQMVKQYIKALPTVEAEPRWIPCSERLPEKSGRYLVTRGLNACDAVWNRVYIINYSDLMGLKSKRIWWDGNVGKSDFKRIDDVTAWMPLPKPYSEVEE